MQFLEDGNPTDSNELRVGLMYPITQTPTRGEYFEVRQVSGGGLRWFAVTKSASGTTVVDTDVDFLQDVTYTFRIQRAGGVVTFSINGDVKRSDGLHLPTGQHDLGLQARRWASGGNLNLALDYISVCFPNLAGR